MAASRITGFCAGILLVTAYLSPSAGQSSFYDPSEVQEIRITFHEPAWEHILDSLFQNYGEEARLCGDVKINGRSFQHCGIRYKGFSSWSEDQKKNPFNIDLDYAIDGQNYQGFTKIKLSNVIHDPSFVREVLSYEIAAKYMPASKSNFARVYVNDTLMGLYTNVEAVDKHFVLKHFGTDDHPFFKGDPVSLQYPFGQNANLAYTHGDDSTGYVPYYKMESERGWYHLFRLIDILNNDTAQISAILNIDQVLWMHAFNYALVNLDSYIAYAQNYYLYYDNARRFNPIIWDLNMSFGSFRHSDAISLNLTLNKVKQLNPLQHLTSAAYSPRPLMKNLFQNPMLKRMYLAHLRTILDENIRNGWYYQRAAELQNLVEPDVLLDSNKFYTYDDFIDNLDTTAGPLSYQYPGLKDLMSARLAYLDTFPGVRGAPLIDDVDASVLAGEEQSIIFNARISGATRVFLAWRTHLQQAFTILGMNDDGQHYDAAAGDSIFGCSVIPEGSVVQYYFYAENDSAGRFSPERAAYEYYQVALKPAAGTLLINEIMMGMTGHKDQNGEADPWIELFNAGEDTVSLLSCYLSDDLAEPLKWRFPDTCLEPGSYLVVWADADTAQHGLHTTFRLDQSSRRMILSYSDYSQIDGTCFEFFPEARSIGRYPNATGTFCSMTPSFAAYNYSGMKGDAGLMVYPNPVSAGFYIDVKDPLELISLGILDVSGRMVMSFNASDEDQWPAWGMEHRTISLPAESLKNGTYFLKAVRTSQTEVVKFVVL